MTDILKGSNSSSFTEDLRVEGSNPEISNVMICEYCCLLDGFKRINRFIVLMDRIESHKLSIRPEVGNGVHVFGRIRGVIRIPGRNIVGRKSVILYLRFFLNLDDILILIDDRR